MKKLSFDNKLLKEKELINRIFVEEFPELLKELFLSRTSWFKHWISIGEGTVGAFSDLEQILTPSIAYNLIPTGIDIALTQTDQDLFIIALSLLSGLIVKSDTTQRPPCFDIKWNDLKQKALSIQDKDCRLIFSSIEEWYRI